MALDAGQFIVTWPASTSTTEAAAGSLALSSTGNKAVYLAAQPTDVYEIGVIVTVVTTAAALTFTAAVDEKTGGTLSTSSVSPSNFATVTGPAAIMPVGTTLKKFVKLRIPKGGNLVIAVTGATGAGATGMFYAIMSVAGAPTIGNQAGAGGLGLTLTGTAPAQSPVANEILSTT